MDKKSTLRKASTSQKLRYMFNSGKNSKLAYYLRAYLREAMPQAIFRRKLAEILEQAKLRSDWDYICDRVDYYNKLSGGAMLDAAAVRLCDLAPGNQTVYYHDTVRYTRYFAPNLRLNLVPGDNIDILSTPSICKSRPVCNDNANDVLLNLNYVRHFIFVNDNIPFEEKRPMAIFRSKLGNPRRIKFMELYHGSETCDCGDVSSHPVSPEWWAPKLSIYDHLQYQMILSLEGNDVASNLKWVMSSNSLAATPELRYETWFMEGRLLPDIHFVKLRDDFADLPEKLKWYNDHPDEARRIIDAAHKWVDQFRDRRREDIISLMVLEKYFKSTGQM